MIIIIVLMINSQHLQGHPENEKTSINLIYDYN